ncbi:hypothetical protein FACS1894167_10620 [Synergistales bacterium]|nr:hypothetical protein FACS1894167_10620 [Synergistales bacterium]
MSVIGITSALLRHSCEYFVKLKQRSTVFVIVSVKQSDAVQNVPVKRIGVVKVAVTAFVEFFVKPDIEILKPFGLLIFSSGSFANRLVRFI